MIQQRKCYRLAFGSETEYKTRLVHLKCYYHNQKTTLRNAARASSCLFK